jgi:hypothetical protein
MDDDGPLQITNEVTILCEGAADRNFLQRLMESRGGFPPVDFLPDKKFSGQGGFKPALMALEGTGVSFRKIRGILIVADSAMNPQGTFRAVCRQVRQAHFPVPKGPLKIALATAGKPSVAIMLLPDEVTPGALESLFEQQMTVQYPWISGCVDAFLHCGASEAHSWEPEKLAKARYHSMVATAWKDDPSRAASVAFRTPAVLDIGAPTFDGVEQRLRAFFAGVQA